MPKRPFSSLRNVDGSSDEESDSSLIEDVSFGLDEIEDYNNYITFPDFQMMDSLSLPLQDMRPGSQDFPLGIGIDAGFTSSSEDSSSDLGDRAAPGKPNWARGDRWVDRTFELMEDLPKSSKRLELKLKTHTNGGGWDPHPGESWVRWGNIILEGKFVGKLKNLEIYLIDGGRRWQGRLRWMGSSSDMVFEALRVNDGFNSETVYQIFLDDIKAGALVVAGSDVRYARKVHIFDDGDEGVWGEVWYDIGDGYGCCYRMTVDTTTYDPLLLSQLPFRVRQGVYNNLKQKESPTYSGQSRQIILDDVKAEYDLIREENPELLRRLRREFRWKAYQGPPPEYLSESDDDDVNFLEFEGSEDTWDPEEFLDPANDSEDSA